MDRFNLTSTSGILVVVGILCIAGGLFLSGIVSQPGYEHHTEAVSESRIPAEADVLEYGSLSPEGKTAFQKSLKQNGSSYVVHGESNKPPEFSYGDSASLNAGIYYIQYDGDYYSLTTFGTGGLGNLVPVLISYTVVIIGVLVVIGGIYRARKNR